MCYEYIFSYKNDRSQYIGEPLSNKNSETVKRGPLGTSFKYSADLGNCDIGKKWLANAGEHWDSFDAFNKDCTDNKYKHLKEKYESFCNNHIN